MSEVKFSPAETLRYEFQIISIKLWCPYLVQHMLHQIKAPQFYTDFKLGLQKHS